MQYEAVIGLEIHAQLLTDSKMFCGCSTRFGSEPNTQTCPVCIGMPGVLPVINKKAIEYVIKTGIAMNCTIAPYSRFARKNYFYPDLPKGYQISQYELPLCEHGAVEIGGDSGTKRIRLTRIHLEEDAGKNIHEGTGTYSLVDLNRAGVPLMEIVTEPDIRSPQEAVAFTKKLRTILRYITVCDGNMEQGSLRCDANVSIRPHGQKEFGVKTEIKNMNSFKFIEKALDYEIKRQTDIVKNGGTITQETRLWNIDTGSTESMRSKEEAHDYRYFPEPDLVPMEVDRMWIEHIKEGVVELPDSKRERFIHTYGLSEADADVLTEESSTALFFEETVKSKKINPKTAANFIMTNIFKHLKEQGKEINEIKLTPRHLVRLLKLIESGTTSSTMAKTTILNEILKSGKMPEQIVKEQGLIQISDQADIEPLVNEILEKHRGEVERYRAGEEKLLGFFVGQIMKATQGKANPQTVNDLLKKKLR